MRFDAYHAGGQPIPRDPLSIGIAAITVFEAASGVAIGFEAAAFVGQVIIASSVIAASVLLTSKPDGSGSLGNFAINAPEMRINRRQPTPHKKIIYGLAETGGDMFFEEAKAPYLTHGFMHCAREIEGFVRCRIGTDVIAVLTTTEFLPTDQIITPQGRLVDGAITASPDYATNLRLSLRTGSTTQVIDPLLDADFTSLEADFRQRGIATAVLRYKWPGTTYDDRQAMWGDGQAPNPLFLIKGVRVYDPRDPTQSRDDESTWQWSDNASLIIADYLRQPYGGRIDAAKIDYDRVAEAADYDDELVGTTTDGEMIRRHTINGVVTMNQAPSEVLRSMLSANRGRVCEQAGTFWVSSSRPKEPVLTIDDSMLAGGIDYQPAKPKRDLLNRVFSRFIASERDYQQVDGPVHDRTDLQATDGEIFAATLSLPFTLDHRRVQRLQKQYLETARLGKMLTLRVSLDAMAISETELLDEVITFDSDLFSPANGNYRVVSVGFAENYAAVELNLSEYDGNIESDWVPADDEQPFEISDLDLT